MAATEATTASDAPTEQPDDTAKRSELEKLKAQASQQYAMKAYGPAAELYADATELQAELNGEMAPQNADLLYAYGRCLYKVAVANSDVLGGKVAGEGEKTGKKRKRGEDKTERVAEEVVEKVVESKEGSTVKAEEDRVKAESKPFFQISGDDQGWSDEDDDEGEDAEDAEADAAAEEEEDDFAIAYEVLDIARILLSRQLEELDGQSKGKGNSKGDSDEAQRQREIKERLADTRDLQAEISLENERFTDAVTDMRACLQLKEELHPKDAGVVAEAHFKLSLALEFASVTTQKDADGNPEAGQEAQVDEGLRKLAAKEMELAIECTRLRLGKEEKSISSLPAEEAAEKRRTVADVKSMIEEMEQRLEDLREPAVSMKGMTGPAGAPDGSDALQGVLGAILGETPAAQKARIEEATKGATDLTSLIRHKKPKKEEGPAAASGGGASGKRKAGEELEVDKAEGKRAKTEEAA